MREYIIKEENGRRGVTGPTSGTAPQRVNGARLRRLIFVTSIFHISAGYPPWSVGPRPMERARGACCGRAHGGTRVTRRALTRAVQLFLSFFKTLVGKQVTVELKNDLQ